VALEKNGAAGRWYSARRQELRGQLWEWDPVGIMGVAEDAYDALVDTVLSALAEGGTEADVQQALGRELRNMAEQGYSSSAVERETAPEVLASAASQLRAWWASAPPRP
jgi:hypothetical protein